MAHRVGVNYRAELVQAGSTKHVFAHPRHAYTKQLLGAMHLPVALADYAAKAGE